jgi:hypothetical protein
LHSAWGRKLEIPMRLSLIAAVLAACSFSASALAAVSPACALLTEDEAGQILGNKVMVTDGGAEVMGSSSCAWVDSVTYVSLMLSVVGGETLSGSSADAWYETQKTGMASAGKVEDVAEIGSKAFISDMAGSLTLVFVKSDKVATLTASQLAKEKLIEAAKAVAGRL